MTVPVAVLVSGRGSNLQALIDACAVPEFPARIVAVVSDKTDAYALERANAAGIAAVTVPAVKGEPREAYDERLHAAIERTGAELVCLAGFMRILSAAFVKRWYDRLLNIHPSLLPAFPGLHTHERAIEAGVKVAGCTVHLVREGVDDGPILIQAAVPVLPADSADTLAARVLEQEHRIYPQALRWMAEGRVRVEKGRALLDGVLLTPLPA